MTARLTVEGARVAHLEAARQRLMVLVILFAGAFALLGLRVVDLGLLQAFSISQDRSGEAPAPPAMRADIVDRNGAVLATNLKVASLYAEPRHVLDPAEAAARLARIFPDLSIAELEDSLSSGRSFEWIKRKLTPRQVAAVNTLGIPGLKFTEEEQRIYPHGRLAAHVLGFADVDGRGLAGVEHALDRRLSDAGRGPAPVALSLDLRVQHAVTDLLAQAVGVFKAVGAGGLVLDIYSGEVLALVSLPDFDPHHVADAPKEARFNRMTKGVYELGSVFKAFTVAQALDGGVASLADGYDASEPIRAAGFLIRDDHPKNRFLSVPEIFVHSSNIGAAKMALDIGADRQKAFLDALGLLRPAALELPEIGRPLLPERWRDIATMTISYGHGIAVTPLQAGTAVAAMVNGGIHRPATLLADSERRTMVETPVISERTSANMRQLMRLAVTRGTGGNADVPGYRVGGKTGTAEKAFEGGYRRDALITSFAGVFPVDSPRYLVLTMLDEPNGIPATQNFRSAGWNAAPLAGGIIQRIAPILGVEPREEDEGLYRRASLLIAEETGR